MADILNFPRIPEKYSGQLIDWMIEASDALRGKRTFQCSACSADVLESDFVKSDFMPDAKFCSIECRNEAEQAAEDNRRTDVRPGSY